MNDLMEGCSLLARILVCRNDECPQERITLPLTPLECHEKFGRWPACPCCGKDLYFTDTLLSEAKRNRTTTGRIRDSQRSKVYRSEREAYAATGLTMFTGRFSLADCQEFVNRVTASKTWENLPDPAHPMISKVFVLDGRGSSRARARMNQIMVPKWARNKPTLIHELAHIATPNSTASHGPEFCRNYMALVSRFLGAPVAEQMKKMFRANRVKFQRPKAMTPAQWMKLRERGRALAAIRKATE